MGMDVMNVVDRSFVGGRLTRLGAASVICASVLALAGCRADYAADITNKTSQPVFASIIPKGGDRAVVGASRRLGPGDRAFVGPVRVDKNKGAYLTVDAMGNPGRPITVDLLEGTAFLEVQQDGTGSNPPMRIVEKP